MGSLYLLCSCSNLNYEESKGIFQESKEISISNIEGRDKEDGGEVSKLEVNYEQIQVDKVFRTPNLQWEATIQDRQPI